MLHKLFLTMLLSSAVYSQNLAGQDGKRPRARDLGIEVGVFSPGALNAITDVAGVRVSHVTLENGDDINTGVTAIYPHGGSIYHDRVPAAIHVGNGYGKLLGVTQIRELGELETPILLTCTLCVWRVADAMVEWLLEQPGMGDVRSLNAVVGETNDGGLNNIRSRPIRAAHVRQALTTAQSGPVEEGSVGAGRGTRAFGWKGGIGTSSRVLPESLGGFTTGVLVQSNFGGILTIDGAPVGQEMGRYSFKENLHPDNDPLKESDMFGWDSADEGQGSIMIIVATDAPLSPLKLERLARRAIIGLGRTGSFAGNGSGDYVISFSTADEVRRPRDHSVLQLKEISNDQMSALFQSAVESTEEAIYNSILKATTVSGMGRTADAIDLSALAEILRRFNVTP
ncbi:MAG TPA: S58 family peptidase [Gemmatimonadetes bacterium]|nr:S58 family peptidase [Gemmatimonadota bacterium]